MNKNSDIKNTDVIETFKIETSMCNNVSYLDPMKLISILVCLILIFYITIFKVKE